MLQMFQCSNVPVFQYPIFLASIREERESAYVELSCEILYTRRGLGGFQVMYQRLTAPTVKGLVFSRLPRKPCFSEDRENYVMLYPKLKLIDYD